jgi:nucleoside-diphosphate-sugar epimerase
VIALTGAASVLGRNLVGLLEEDPRVRSVIAIDVKPRRRAAPRPGRRRHNHVQGPPGIHPLLNGPFGWIKTVAGAGEVY